MIASILVQEQNYVVLQRCESECTQEMDASFGGDLLIAQDSADEQQENVAEGPASVAEQEILVKLLQGQLFVLGEIPVDQLDQLF